MKNELYPLGRFSKTHGYNGAMLLVSNIRIDDEAEQLKELFVVVDGLKVPFRVENFELMTDTSARAQLEFVNCETEAQRFVGCEVFSTLAPNPDHAEENSEMEQWIGYELHDELHGKVGNIRKVEDYKGNIVMQAVEGDKEILISYFPELVTGVDKKRKILRIRAPEGYF